MGNLAAVAGGGALGALMRYGVGVVLAGRGGFPWATLSVNVIGSLLFGFLAIWLTERMPLAVELRAFVLIGVLGAFTTFSAFSWETLMLLQQGETTRAAMNMFASVMLCILAAAAGIWLARQIL
ncbi:MAG: fluoride efflux transporter CrcB [Proteobacteria bacterium]|nr:fluoride efflux transporter CrcB [Pseudomonadota bacterium]